MTDDTQYFHDFIHRGHNFQPVFHLVSLGPLWSLLLKNNNNKTTKFGIWVNERDFIIEDSPGTLYVKEICISTSK